MTVNTPNHQVQVEIGSTQMGRVLVPYPPGSIEMVRILGYHGVPHVIPAETPDQSWIEVLGAVPDTSVTVSFYVEER